MNITYLNSNDNAVKSHLAFQNLLYPRWKEKLRVRSFIISTLLLPFLLYIGYQLKIGFTSNGIYLPIASLILHLICSLPVSVFMGWLAFRIPVVSQENAIIVSYRGLPSDYLGNYNILLNNEGMSIKAPYYEIKYNWKLINSIKKDNDFIFFCYGNRLIFSIPIAALGSQSSTFITQAESLISNP